MTPPSSTSTAAAAVDAEQRSFEATIREVEEWWKTPRQRHLVRPYSAKTVAALRGSQTLPCIANPAALKLWDMLHEHRRNGTAEMTLGATDPIAVSQMAKHMKTVYVSGGLSGFSENLYPGMDHADYPWDTVPKVVDKIFRSQVWHDQRQRQFRLAHPPAARAALENYDYLMPIIADGDMGFGSPTATIKATKALAEMGAAAIHIDDLAIGLKQFTTGQGRTVVPTCEYADRLTAVRLELDILGAETLVFARCDTDHAEFLTSVVDPRDHAYVLGATNSAVSPLREVLQDAAHSGKEVTAQRTAWMATAGLMTFDDAVAARAAVLEKAGKLDSDAARSALVAYKAATPYGTSLVQRRAAATAAGLEGVFFDWELPRSGHGQYMFRPNVQTIVERALAVASLGDVSWSRMDFPDYNDLKEYHEAMLKHLPGRLFAFAWGTSWSFPASKGWTPERRRDASQTMARDYGVVWQVQPMYVIQGVNMEIERTAAMWTERGIGGYYDTIQAAADKYPFGVDGYDKMSWCGGYLSDALFSAIAGEEIISHV